MPDAPPGRHRNGVAPGPRSARAHCAFRRPGIRPLFPAWHIRQAVRESSRSVRIRLPGGVWGAAAGMRLKSGDSLRLVPPGCTVPRRGTHLEQQGRRNHSLCPCGGHVRACVGHSRPAAGRDWHWLCGHRVPHPSQQVAGFERCPPSAAGQSTCIAKRRCGPTRRST